MSQADRLWICFWSFLVIAQIDQEIWSRGIHLVLAIVTFAIFWKIDSKERETEKERERRRWKRRLKNYDKKISGL